MTIERAVAHSSSKPWGVVDTRPWSSAGRDGNTIGEIRYERSALAAASSLLLKLLFTSQPVSIQVHPNDAYARSVGLPNGKTEAWHVLRASSDAKVALGLKQHLTSQELHSAADDGSISDLVVWKTVSAGDTIFVPAGTIHAIGAGLVIAEIQQRSDVTYRLFDYDRGREIHVDKAVAVADTGPASIQPPPSRLTSSRAVLTSNALFTFEKIDLPPNSTYCVEAKRETWLLVVGGGARYGSFEITIGDIALGDAIFAQSDRLDIQAGGAGMSGLLAYTGGFVPDLVERFDMETTQ